MRDPSPATRRPLASDSALGAHPRAGPQEKRRDTPLVDATDRVRGRTRFVDDLRIADTLHGRFLRSPHAHARILSVDTSKAERIPGVKAIITGRDAPRRYGILPVGQDETALAIDRVRYFGEEVAAVAATSPEIAAEAARAIEVEYDLLPAYLTARDAMNEGAIRIHDDRPRNIEKEYHHVFGDPAAGLEAAAVVVEDSFFHPRVTHAALEPHGSLATHGPEGRYTIWTSTQTPRHVQRGVAEALGIPQSAIRVVPSAVGGGFGGKSETFPADVAACILSRISGQPVRFILGREEVFLLHRGRPESHVHMRLGLTREGKIAAVECETIQDGGAYCGYGVVTILYSGALLCALYDVQNMRFDGYRVITNKPACGPMRGHGTIGARHAFEVLLDRAAEALVLDPIEVRRRNLLRPGVNTINDLRVTSYGFPECIDRVCAASGWAAKRGRLPRGRGIGFGASHYVSGAANAIVRGNFPHSTVKLEADRDGGVTLFTGASEIGQGSSTVLAVIVGEVLGLDPAEIRIVSGDTALTPADLGTYASRVTFMTGNAALEAARKLRDRLVARAARRLGVPAEDLELARGRIRISRSARQGDETQAGRSQGTPPGHHSRTAIPFAETLRLVIEEEGPLVTTGSYWPPRQSQGGRFPGAGVGPGVSYSYAAQVVEVDVDRETGELHILKVWAAHDCGRALNPIAVRGQVEGSVWMGIGQALSEEVRFSSRGQILNPGLLEYKVPTSLDSPEVEVLIVESGDPEGPFGAKEAGEGSLAAILPALTNAVYDAIGVWITDLPLTPERILAAIAAARNERRIEAPSDARAPDTGHRTPDTGHRTPDTGH